MKYQTGSGAVIDVKINESGSTSIKGNASLQVVFPDANQSWNMTKTALEARLVKPEDVKALAHDEFTELCNELGIPAMDRIQVEQAGEDVDTRAETKTSERDELKAKAKELGIKVLKSMSIKDLELAITKAESEEE